MLTRIQPGEKQIEIKSVRAGEYKKSCFFLHPYFVPELPELTSRVSLPASHDEWSRPGHLSPKLRVSRSIHLHGLTENDGTFVVYRGCVSRLLSQLQP